MKHQLALIAYDIACNRRRRRAYRILQRWKLDSQYSLFECELGRREAEELFLQLSNIIHSSEDRLLLAWLDPKRRAKGLTRCATPGFQRPLHYLG